MGYFIEGTYPKVIELEARCYKCRESWWYEFTTDSRGDIDCDITCKNIFCGEIFNFISEAILDDDTEQDN